MTFLEFKTAVDSFLDVDARRRGLDAFKSAYIKQAISDMKAYIDYYAEVQNYADDDQTPFDNDTAEAAAEFYKSKVARNVDKDPQLSQLHMASYMNLRRRIHLRIKERFMNTFAFEQETDFEGRPILSF